MNAKLANFANNPHLYLCSVYTGLDVNSKITQYNTCKKEQLTRFLYKTDLKDSFH